MKITKEQIKEYRRNKEAKRAKDAMSDDNLVTLLGSVYERKNKDTDGYKSLKTVWQDLYKRAVDYNNGFSGFYDAYSVTRNNNGYVADTGKWYSDLEEMRNTANEDIDSLLAEIDQYSRYFNEDAVSYMRELVTKPQQAYEDALSDAKKFSDYWSQFKNAGDYEFRQAIAEGKDKETLKEIFDRMKAGYGSLFQFYRDIDYAKDYALWFDYDPTQYDKNAKRIAEIEKMFDDEWALESLAKEAWSQIQSLGGEASDRDKLREELENLKSENARFLRFADPEAYQAQLDEQARLENMPWYEKALYTAGDVFEPILYGGTRAVENLVELVPRGYMAMKDASMFLASETAESLLYGIPGVKEEVEKQTKEWEETKQKWTEDLDKDWTAAQTGYTGDAQKGSYLYDISPELQQGVYDVGEGIGNMAPAIAASAVNPMLGQAVFFGSAAGGGATEASEEGADATTALLYGLASGGAEMLTEKIGGNMFGQPTDLASSWVGKQLLKKGADKYVSQGLGKAAYTFVSEGIEESIMDLISPGLKVGFDIGDAKERYSHWDGGWEDVIKGIPKTFVVGGAVGSVIEGIYAGASAIENISAGKKSVGGLKGGVALNAVSKEMSHIADTLKAVEAVNQSATASQVQKNEYAIAANGSVLDSIAKISSTVQSLSEEQRANMFEEVPVLRSYLNEDGSVRVELEKLMGLSSSIIADNIPTTFIKSFAGKSNEEITSRIEKRLSAQIGNEAQRHKLATTISNIVQGKEFSGAAIKAVTGNEYALKVLNDYLGTKLTSNAKAKDVRLAVAERSGDNSAKGQAEKFSAILGLGENGTRGLVSFVNNAKAVNVGNLAQAFNDVYRLGMKGADIDLARNPYLSMLNEEQMVLAYNYGVMDRAFDSVRQKSSDEVLQNDTESGTIKEKAQEGVENEQGEEGSSVRLRDGGERKSGTNTDRNLSSMEGRTGEAEARGSGRDQEKRSASIRAFVEAEGLSKVSSKSKGISTGTDTKNIVGLPESVYDEGMRQIVEEQAAQGRKVIFVSGALEIVENGEIIEARGVISADGKTIWIQADDATVSPEQIALHEEFHAKVKADPSLIARMKKKVKEKYKGKLELLTEVYANLYFTDDKGKRTVSDDYIIEEILADAYAGIDVLETISDVEVRATEFGEDIREGAKNIESARAPPSSGEVKASRYSKDIYTATDDYIRDVIKEDRHAFARSLANQTTELKNGSNAVIEIFGAKRIYIFRADGFMTGEVLKSISNKRPTLYKKAREEYLNEIERSGEGPALWSELDSSETRSDPNHTGFFGHRGSTNANDILSEKSPSGDSSRSDERSGGYNHSAQEIDTILESLKKMYGADDAGIKASRSLKSPEDVAQAYLDAVPNRLILANALESQADNPKAKELLAKYKSNITNIEADQAELDKTKSELHDLYFSKGKRNTERIKTLESRKEKLEARIDNADRWLLKYEETKPIKDIIARERDRAYKKAIAEGNAKIAKMQARMKDREQKARQERREMRERASDRRHSSEIRGNIKAFKDKLQNALQHPTDRQYIPGALAQAIIDVCELIDTDTELYRDDGSINKAQERREKTRERLRILRAEYNNIAKDADPLFAEEYDAAIAEYLEELESKFSGKSLNDMSRAELEEMYAILQSIDATLKDARKLIGEAEAADVYEAGNIIIEEQKDIAKKRKNGKRGAVKKLNDGAGNYSLSPMRRMLEICAYDKNSPLYKIFQQFEKGVRKAKFFKMEVKKSFESLMKNKAYDNAIYKADGGDIYTDSRGRKFGISKMQKMQAILSLEREVANKTTHHIDIGGLVFADLSELGKGKLKSAIDAEHSHEIVGADAVRLIEQFKKELEGDSWAQDYMKAAREFFNVTAKNAINDTYMQLKHRILATEDAYIPFEVDQNSIYREINSEYQIQETISSYGMLKEKQGGASNPLIMTGLNNVLDRHIEQVGTIQGLAIPIRNFNKIWNVKSSDGSNTNVKTKIQEVAGEGAVNLIIQTVRDLQGDRPKSDKLDGVSRAYKKVKRNYIIATFYANMSVMFKQIGSMFSATAVIAYRSPVRMMGNLIYTFANSKKIAAEVDQYTATAWERRQGLSDAELQTLKTERRKTKAGKAFDNAGSYFMIKMDYTVALSLWKYAKQDVAKKTGLRGEELLKATAEYYDEVIETTQSMTDVLHRPEVQRGGGVGAELLGTFKTDLYQNAGNLRIAMGEFAQNRTQENAKKLVKTVSAVMTSAIWGSIVTSLAALARYKVDRYRDDEDDELTPESWFKVQGMDILQELMGYAIPLFGSEAFEGVLNLGAGKSLGNVVASAIPYDAVNDLYDSVCKLYPKIRDGEELTRSDYFKLIKDCGNVLGIPTSNLLRFWEAGILHYEDLKNGELFSFEAGLKDPNPYRLYKAMLEGDKDKIEKASRKFKNDDAITKAIRDQLREQDPRIREAAMAYIAGDMDRWDELYNEILEEGIFDEEDIGEAIKSESNSYATKVKEAAQAKADGEDEAYESILDELFEKYETVVDEDELLDDIDGAYDQIKESEGDPKAGYSRYNISDVNAWFNSGNTERAMEVLDELKKIKSESSLQSSTTSYWKPKYVAAYKQGDREEMRRIKDILRKSGFYENVEKTTKNWVN